MTNIDQASRIAVILIATILLFAALDAIEYVAAPVALAAVTGVILAPLTDRMADAGLPRSVAAFLSFFAGVAAILVAVFLFQPAVTRAADAFPRVYRELNSTLYLIQAELRGLQEVEEDVRALIDRGGGSGGGGDQAAGNGEGSAAADAIPSVEDMVLLAPSIAGRILIYLGAFFFFVLTRLEIYDGLARRFARPQNRLTMSRRFTDAERQVSRYFLTISVINAGLGAATAVAMMLLGMPSPLMWGFAAFLLNFVIYVGPTAFVIALGVAGLVQFDGILVVAPAAAFLFLNMIESQFVTPSLLGRSLAVNPLLIFVTLSFFLWLWGAIGAIVAIPLLLWIIAFTLPDTTPAPARVTS
ncbi:AI-2E family transporter [Rhodobacterales bacterium HKCCE3408]|nr:AI-2E family transporter [Rhodobacterales bacterium HKCCE3408]